MTPPTPLVPLQFPLHGSRLIEASAGTGKTWTIAALYVRLVLGHGQDGVRFRRPLLPTEILVVTFTEAATKELRGRVRARLTEAARAFRGQGKPDDFLRALIDSYPETDRPACARRLEIAAEWMDEAAIYTIHGWCHRMLRQHAFDSGALFNMEVNASDTELLAETARDYWRSFFYPLDPTASLAVVSIAASPEALLGTLKPLLGETLAEWWKDGQPATVPTSLEAILKAWADWETARQALEQAARACWTEHRADLETLLRKASEDGWLSGSVYRKDSFEARLKGLAAWAESGADCETKWLAGFAQNRFKMNKKYQDQTPKHPAFAKLEAFVDHLEKEPDYRTEVLIHAAEWVRRRYAVEKRRRARMDFDDLLNHLDAALQGGGGPRLAEIIRAQFPVALIDEFQDTDPVQYRIFDAIYRVRDNGRDLGLFMIGDPKQAIYSFRGADLHTYLRARAATAGRHYTLGCNFRSTHALTAAVNGVFEQAEKLPDGAFKFKSGDGENPLPFLAVEAQGREEALFIEGEAAPVLTLWQWAGQGALALTNYREVMADAAATEIVRLLNLGTRGKAGFRRKSRITLVVPPSGGAGPAEAGTTSAEEEAALRPADIAILVRSHIEAEAMRRALDLRGLRSVYLSDRESVFETQEATDLLFWLRAAAEPERDRNLRAALATATLALSYADLDELNNHESSWEAEVERFRDYRKIWRLQGVLPMLYRLLTDFAVPARLLSITGGERSLTNILHLAELLQSASTELDGELALIRWLAEAIGDGQGGEDEHILRLESDAGLIKVVTIHKSKGLEYPLVFLPFVCSFREVSGRGRTHFRYHGDNGEVRIDFGLSDEARRRADQERLQEDLRLLYVALTRARHACWLGVAPVKAGNTKECQLEKAALGHLLAGGAAIPAAELGAGLARLRGGCESIRVVPAPEPGEEIYRGNGAGPELEPARIFTGRIPEHWWIASYSALKLDAPGQGEPEAIGGDTADAPDTAVQSNLMETGGEIAAPVFAMPAGPVGLHDFPRGANPGVFLHGLLEWAAREGFGRVAGDGEAAVALRREAITRRCEVQNWLDWVEPLDGWLRDFLAAPFALEAGEFIFGELQTYQPELEFWFGTGEVDTRAVDELTIRYTLDSAPRPPLTPDRLNGAFKGFMDLVFEYKGRYYVADYKSNRLGSDGAAYTPEAMREAILEKRYELQYTIYLLALHRQLRARLGAAYDYDTHIGGAVYLFLRGLDGET
ncbi:exodeoxyribonuclease V subunit beta, partial [Methylomagnum sp.]